MEWNDRFILTFSFLNFPNHSFGHPSLILDILKRFSLLKGRKEKRRKLTIPEARDVYPRSNDLWTKEGGGGKKVSCPVSINGGAATKGAARKSFGSFQRSSRPPVEKKRRERERGGSTARKDVEQWKAARRYKPLIINPLLRSFFRLASFLPSPPWRAEGGTKNETRKERGPFSVPPGSRRNAAIVSPLSRHCRTIKREDKADPQRSCLA